VTVTHNNIDIDNKNAEEIRQNLHVASLNRILMLGFMNSA